MYSRDTLAKNLAFQRVAVLGQTQQELANSIGFSSNAVSRNKRGINDPSIEYLVAFADHAKVSLDTLVGREIDSISVQGLTAQQKRLEENRVAQIRAENQKKR